MREDGQVTLKCFIGCATTSAAAQMTLQQCYVIYHKGHVYRKSGNFSCKNIFGVDDSYKKLNLRKSMHTINVNVVRGHITTMKIYLMKLS